jgi:hypothetical protein
MRLLRQFTSISRRPTLEPLIVLDKATIYPLGETLSPCFHNLTWQICESETWAVIGPSLPGRRILLEVNSLEVQVDEQSRCFKGNIDVLLLLLSSIRSFSGFKLRRMAHNALVHCGRVMSFIIYVSTVLFLLRNITLSGMKRIEMQMIPR